MGITVIRKIRAWLMKGKFYMGRTTSYIGIINLIMLMYLTLEKLADNGTIHFNVGKYIIPIYVGSVLLLIAFGYVEVKVLKGLRIETDLVWQSTAIHPELQDMKHKIDYLYSITNGEKNGNSNN